MVFFDKDSGADLFVRAAGGTHLPLRNGVPTGCAPLKALDLTAQNKIFLTRWVGKLVGATTRELTVTELRDIASAVDGLADLPVERRTIGALRTFLNNTDPEGIASRLRRWERGGPLGWVFDNVADDIGIGAKFIGYDMTDFLDNEEIRTPLMAYLFYRVEQLIDGRRIIIVIDEFWKALQDEGFRDLAQNKLKTIRKQNGLMLFATQSPRDAIVSPIAHTIIEQCPTQMFLPNPRGDRADYVDGFKLTEREFELIARELSIESRRFIVKQGHNSVVAELNLNGFDDELAVLSGRTANVELADAIRSELGEPGGLACLVPGTKEDSMIRTGSTGLFLATAALLASFGIAQAQGIPVIDESAIAKQIESITQLKSQLDALNQQLQHAQQLYGSLNKITNMADVAGLLNDPSIRKALPQDFNAIEGLFKGSGMRVGSERLAANALRITQPAVSQNLKQLEATVGFELFRRESNRLIPTDKTHGSFCAPSILRLLASIA